MPQVTLDVASVGDTQDFSTGAGSIPTLLHTNDGNTSYRTTTTDANIDLWNMDQMAQAVASITEVKTTTVAVCVTAASTITARHKAKRTSTANSANVVHEDSPYNAESIVWALDSDSLAWTKDSVNNHQFGYEQVSGSGLGFRVTQFQLFVTFVPAAGAFYWIMGCWLPPLLEVASHGVGVTELARFYRQTKLRPSTKEEFCRILEAFRVRPRFCFGG